MWERRGKKCGFHLPCVFFGLFGRKEIVGLLKMMGIQFKGVHHFSFVIFGHGLRGFFLLWPPFLCGFCRLVRLWLRGSFFSLLYITCIL